MKKIKRILLAVLVVALVLAGSLSALAAVGTSDNPLVTLSYLTDTFTKSILSQTQSEITAAQSSYESKLDAKVSSASAGSSSSGYSVVTLTKGQTLTGKAGCEVMLRSGTALCQSTASTGLTDTTAGSDLASGKTLVKNHLYLVGEDTRGVLASTAVTLLVRGSYTIQ